MLKCREITIFSADFSLINVYPQTFLPVKSSTLTTSQASSSIQSGVPLPSLLGLDDLDDIPESCSGQSYTTTVSSAKQPVSPTLLSSKQVVIITSSPTYTTIVLSNNKHESKCLTSDLPQRTQLGSQYCHISRRKVNISDTSTHQLDCPSASWRGQNTSAKSRDDAQQKVIGTSPEVTETQNHTKKVSRPSLVHLLRIFNLSFSLSFSP